MSTKVFYTGVKPSISTGADVENHGPHDVASIDQTVRNLQSAADTALTALGGFSASQTPGANQIPVVKADSSVVLPGPLTVNAVAATDVMLKLNGAAGKFTQLGFYENSELKWNVYNSGSTLYFGNGDGTKASISATGDLLVGVTSGSYHEIKKVTAAANAGNQCFKVSGTSEVALYVADVSGGTFGNAANSAIYLNKDAITSRSINAGGTINASGADYAEYERKSDACGAVAKGQIIGFDAEGRVTDKWSEAISFGIKSTDPNLVGGDTWGAEDVVGKRPEQPIRVADATEPRLLKPAVMDGDMTISPAEYETIVTVHGDTDDEWVGRQSQYEVDLAAFEARLEAERQTVDRIAYSGKVPVNVRGAQPGDYIIAVHDGDGIGGLAIADPDFDQYKKAVGRVRRLLPDGRSEVAVMVH